MAIIATENPHYSNLVKREDGIEWGQCKKVVTINGAAATLPIGSVLGSFIASPVGTAGAVVGTGNGTMGTITMTSNANLQLGKYTLKIVKAVANAGDFLLLNPQGLAVGHGQVAVAFNQAGFAFTLADGATDFVVGDTITITVTGTVKYKLIEATATDGTEVAKAVVVGDATGNPVPVVATLNTDVNALVLYRGVCAVADTALNYGASVDTDAEKAAIKAQLEAVGIDVLAQY